jgi:hypothetical protein
MFSANLRLIFSTEKIKTYVKNTKYITLYKKIQDILIIYGAGYLHHICLRSEVLIMSILRLLSSGI